MSHQTNGNTYRIVSTDRHGNELGWIEGTVSETLSADVARDLHELDYRDCWQLDLRVCEEGKEDLEESFWGQERVNSTKAAYLRLCDYNMSRLR